jgi:hypothetical protein
MSWLGRWGRTSGPSNDERRVLEAWVRLRFQLAASDPMIAIIGAVGRLTDAGMDTNDAVDTVLRILHEEVADGSAPRSLSIGMRQSVVEFSGGAPPRSLGAWAG